MAGMGRWQPDARGRLEQAALALYDERGYDATTVADIAERAGLTKRTYFRYFADKREVLFGGSAQLEELLVHGVEEAPPAASPLDAVVAALEATGPLFAERREHAIRRQAIVDAHSELQERELIKLASLARAIAGALRRRGVPDPTATIAAETGITVFKVAFERWVAPGGDPDLAAVIRTSLDGLRAVTAGAPPPA